MIWSGHTSYSEHVGTFGSDETYTKSTIEENGKKYKKLYSLVL